MTALFLMVAGVMPCLAEDIKIVNKTKEEITIAITPESNIPDPFPTVTKTIPAQEESTLMVNYDDLKDHKYYNIKKIGGDFTGLSRCDHLSVNKNYAIEFEKQPIGLMCTAQEID